MAQKIVLVFHENEFKRVGIGAFESERNFVAVRQDNYSILIYKPCIIIKNSFLPGLRNFLFSLLYNLPDKFSAG